MGEASFFVAVVLGLIGFGVFIGYHFRDFVGKEVAKFAADLRTSFKAAQAELEQDHVLLQKTYETAKADAEKAIADLSAAKDRALATIEAIKKA